MDEWRRGGGVGGGNKGIDGVHWGELACFHAFLCPSGAPRGLLMPLSAMQY